MELIDRYVHEVGRYLPPRSRKDIQAEIRSSLMDSLEARVQGQPSQEDIVSLLKEFGAPAKVAASYHPQSQYLVGPELFPLFRTVVGIALLVLVIVHLVLFGVLLATNPDPLQALDILSGFFGHFVSVLGAIVLVFYVLQYFDVRLKASSPDWDPLQLPQIELKNEIKHGETIFDVALSTLLLAVLLIYPSRLGVVVSPGTPILVDPVINSNIPLIAAALLLGLLINIVLLWRGRWEMVTRLAKTLSSVFSIAVIAILLSGHNAWLAEHTQGGFFGLLSNLPIGQVPTEQLTLTVSMFFVQWALIIALIVTLVSTVETAYRLVRQLLGWDSVPTLPPAQK